MAYNQLNGAIRNTTLPAFYAYFNATASNVTGDGTAYTAIFNTELFDQASNYDNATGIFTAPVDGKYQFNADIYLSDVGANTIAIEFVSTQVRNVLFYGNGAAAAGGLLIMNGSAIIQMARNDTCSVLITCGGGAKIIDVVGAAATAAHSGFGGHLIC